jgi:DNA-binding response OmpR family regulator
MKLAVVDDDFTSRTILKDFLEDQGYQVEAADRPEELKDLSQVNLLIMDVMIYKDRLAGINFILDQKLRGKISEQHGIIFISNYAKSSVIDELLSQLGEIHKDYEWFDKPLNLIDFHKSVKNVLRRKKK